MPFRGGDLPLWSWVALGLTLCLLFLAIVFYPAYRARQLARRMEEGGQRDGVAAAQALVRLGSDTALAQLTRLALSDAADPVRRRAIDALGRFPNPEARKPLRQVIDDPASSAVLVHAAQTALLRHQARFGDR